MSFSATDAAFEGFRVVRRAPLSLVFWTLIYLVAGAAMFGLAGSQLAKLMAMSEAMETAEPSFAEIAELGRGFAGVMAVLVPISLVLGAMLAAAVARAVLRPEARAWGYLRFGMDEVRVLVVQVVVSLALFAVLMLIYLVLAGIGAAAISMEQPWMWLIVVLGALAGFGLVIWLAVRWSLATPIAVAEKRIAPFASFGQTRGRFWSLLGMALLAAVMAIVVSLLVSIITFPATLAFGSMEKSLAGYDGQDIATILSQGWAAILVWGLINALSSALQLAVLYAPFTAAYVALKARP